jgi:AcrR family transcriptional regulator
VPRRQPVPRAAGQAESAGPSTKQRIEQAALQLFASKGFEATGIRDIAVQAGISTAALYHYMGSKDELLIDFMLVSMVQLTRVVREALAAAGGPTAELATLVRAHVGFHMLDPQRSLVADDELRALSDEAFGRVMELRDGYERIWADTLDRGLSSSEFRFSDASITRLALLEMCNGVARWYSDEGPKQPIEIADDFAGLAMAMVDAGERGGGWRQNQRCMPTGELLELIQRVLREPPGALSQAEVVA